MWASHRHCRLHRLDGPWSSSQTLRGLYRNNTPLLSMLLGMLLLVRLIIVLLVLLKPLVLLSSLALQTRKGPLQRLWTLTFSKASKRIKDTSSLAS